MAISYTDIKQKAIDAFNSAVEQAKVIVVDTVKTKVKEYSTSLISGGVLAVQPVLSKIKDLKDTADNIGEVYSTTVAAAEVVKANALGPEEMAIEVISQAAELYKNQTLNTNGLQISIGVSKKDDVLGALDPTIEPDNSDIGLYLKFSGSKVKLNSINELISVVNTINKKLDSDDAETTIAWVHKIVKTHPLVDDAIKDLTYFKPISNEVGSTYLMHTTDTQTLALEDWATELPNPIRNTLQYKMDESYQKINNMYYELNKGMSRNISTEFFYERPDEALKDQGNNYLDKSLLSNDFHIAGDYAFYENHVGLLEQILMTALIGYVGGAGKLINWLVPVNSYEQAFSGGVSINVEGNNVVVDLKGNKIGVIATVIDTTPIANTVEV